MTYMGISIILNHHLGWGHGLWPDSSIKHRQRKTVRDKRCQHVKVYVEANEEFSTRFAPSIYETQKIIIPKKGGDEVPTSGGAGFGQPNQRCKWKNYRELKLASAKVWLASVDCNPHNPTCVENQSVWVETETNGFRCTLVPETRWAKGINKSNETRQTNDSPGIFKWYATKPSFYPKHCNIALTAGWWLYHVFLKGKR